MPVLIEKGKIKYANREMTSAEIEKNNNVIAMDFIMEKLYVPYVPTGGMAMRSATKMDHRIAVLQAATGSGKGSIGLELLFRFGEATRKTVIQTQPTTATAVSVPYEVMGIPKYASMLKMGETIGYATGSFVKIPTAKKSVIFTTTGYLAQVLKSNADDRIMKKYSFILLDEAHARSLDYDLVFFLMKKFMQRNLSNPNCPFLLMMSATLPTNKYAKYFDIDSTEIISVPGQTYPKEDHYADADYKNYMESSVELIIKIHNEEKDAPEKGDIICFVWGAKPMRDMTELLEAENEKAKSKFIISKIDSGAFKTGTSEYFNVLRALKNLTVTDAAGKRHTPTRRVILATPVVEVGLTLESLRYCIETGYFNSVEYNPIFNVVLSTPKPVTQANSLQRIGRVGRKAPGVFHTMYTKNVYDSFLKDALPDVIKSDMSSLLLNLIIAESMPATWDKTLYNYEKPTSIFDVQSIDLLDYPAADSLRCGYEKLFVLGLIDASSKPTFMGVAATYFRAPLENIRMIFEGYINGANVQDLITIAAIIDADPTRLTNNNKKIGPTYKPRPVFGSNIDVDMLNKKLYMSCDIIELLFAFYDICDQITNLTPNSRSTLYLQDWMKDNGLVYANWLTVFAFRDSYMKTLIGDIGLNPYQNGLGLPKFKYDIRKIINDNTWSGVTEIRKLKAAMLEGYRLNTATWNNNILTYVNDHTHVPINVKSPMLLPLPDHDRIKQTMPRHIMTFIVSLRLPPRSTTGIYEFGTYIASALDGFVNVDKSFTTS
jgi:HrpA-like RNA helicase